MGYRISSLASLPAIPGKDLYVFILGMQYWDGSLLNQVEKNFAKIAQNIGPKGAIIMGHEGVDLGGELMMTEHMPSGLSQLLMGQGIAEGGGVLILGAHPTELKEDDLVLYAPLEALQTRFGGLPTFFEALCQFSKTRDPSFLKKFQSKETKLDVFLKLFDLKPGMFGIGVNINKFIEMLK
jgi:hypothetical protein